LRLITRGLTGGAGAIILTGLGGVAVELVRIVRGGKSAASRALKDLTETFKITAMLISTNGKEFVRPIFSSVSREFNISKNLLVTARPKKLIAKRDTRTKVSVTKVSVRNKKNE
jgi:uncharacterized protein YprB with RNaseH-like and TPR domain